MFDSENQVDDDGTQQWDNLRSLVIQFHESWEDGSQLKLEAFLDTVDLDRKTVLLMLARTDMEARVAVGEMIRVEDYMRRFPELESDAQALNQLILHEYILRSRFEEKPSHDEFHQRFPLLDQDQLAQLDAEHERASAIDVTTDWSRGLADTQVVDPQFIGGNAADLPQIPGYEILGLINSGGMGSVFKARDLKLERIVAIKIPRPALLEDETGRERFLREARAAARLRHVNICPIHEIGESNERPYISMAFIDGATLREESFHAKQAAEVMAKLARAIEHAHSQGVIHRDIKPANVLIEAETGEPILTDFGLAKELTGHQSQMTQTGDVMGTPAYMAPEQAAGRIDEVGPLTDVYALGAVLYELLGGEPPFRGPVGEVLRKVQTDEPAPLRKLVPRLHVDLETICLKSLSKDPSQRYQSAAELADDLDRFVSGESILARRASVVTKAARVIQKRPVTAALVVLLACLAIVAAGLMRRVRTSTRIANAISVIDRELQTDEWNQQKLGRISHEIDALDLLSKEHAGQQQQRVQQRLIDKISSQVTAVRITTSQIEKTEGMIDLLEILCPSEAARLRSELQRRARSGVAKIDLRPPFNGSLDVFPGVQVTTDDGALLPKTHNDLQTVAQPSMVLTNVSSDRNAALEARFDSRWPTASSISLMLDARDGHRDAVAFLDFSPNGQLLASAGRDGRVIVWDAESGKNRFQLDGLDTTNFQMEFSPSGQFLLTWEKSGLLRVWNAGTGELHHEIAGTTSRFAFSSDGQRLATGAINPLVTIWDAETWTKVTEILHEGRAFSLAFSPDDRQLAVGFHSHEVCIWDLTTDGPPATLDRVAAWPTHLKFSPDGKLLACASFDQSVHLWDLANRTRVGGHHIPQNRGLGFDFAPDGTRLYVTRATQINVWDLTANKYDYSSLRTLISSRASNLLQTRDGRYVAVSDRAAVKVWEATNLQRPSKQLRTRRAVSLAASPTGNLLAAGTDSGIIDIWDLPRSRKVFTLGQTGYEAVITAGDSPDSAAREGGRATFAEAFEDNRQLAMRIKRAGVLLHEKLISASGIDRQSIRLDLIRRDQVVQFMINGEYEVAFEDLFPIHPSERGVYAIGWPANVGLFELTATAAQLASQPSALERADELFAHGKFSEAGDLFHQTVIEETDIQLRQEAAFKEGLCLVERGHQRDAIQLFDELSGQSPSRWTRLASFRLWTTYLDEGATSKADDVFDRLAVSEGLEELQLLIPTDVRRRILSQYGDRLFNYRNLLQISRSRVDDVQTVEEVSRFLAVEAEADLKFELLRAFRLMEQEGRALSLAKELADSSPASRVIHHLSWLLRDSGQQDEAMKLIDSWLADDSGGFREDMLSLLIERARIHAAKDEWGLAEEDIDRYLDMRGQQAGPEFKYGLPTAYLLKGFLRQRDGDPDAAIQAWGSAYRPWHRFLGAYSVPPTEKSTAFIHCYILGSLSGKLRYVEAKFFLDKAIESGLPSSLRAPLMAMFFRPDLLGKVTASVQKLWTTSDGRLWAERIAFEQVSYAEVFRTAALLPAFEILITRSFDAPSDDERELLWSTLGDVYRQTLETKELHENQAMLLALSWGTGLDFTENANLSEWIADLPTTAAGVAYICASRCAKEDKTAAARQLFTKVVEWAGSDSLTGSLASKRLSELKSE